MIPGAELVVYGFLKASTMYATDPIVSFNNSNMVAPTAAANKTLYAQGNDRTSFQVAQSRLGTSINTKNNITGIFEIDFIDFSQSSPTTQSRPRLRRAFIEKKFENNWSVQIGQDWDTFSPTRPDTYDIIGLYFNGGNTGFMREQIKVKKETQNFSYEVALGQANKNTGVGNNQVEEDNQLSLAMNTKFHPTKSHTVIFSAITGRTTYSNTQSKDPYGVSLGYELKKGKNKLSAESYYGHGLAQLNLLDLPGSQYAESLGGYLTYQRALTDDVNLRIGQGFAKRSSAGSSSLNTDKSYSNLGMHQNLISRISIAKSCGLLDIYGEFSHFRSQYLTSSKSNSLESGLLFTF